MSSNSPSSRRRLMSVPIFNWALVLIAALLQLALAPNGAAQPVDIKVGGPAATAVSTNAPYVVSGYRIKGFWIGDIDLPLKKGDLWTPEKNSEVNRALLAAFGDRGNSYLMSQRVVGSGTIIYYSEKKNEADHTVHLEITPIFISTSLAQLGENLLPIGRSASPLRFDAVPKPLLALKPSVGMSYDRAFGTSVDGGFQGDLLGMKDIFGGNPPEEGRADSLDVTFRGSKSFDPYYRADADFAYARRLVGHPLQEISVSVAYEGAREPLSDRDLTRNSVRGDLGGVIRLAPHTQLGLNTGFRHDSDLLEDSLTSSRVETDVQPNRVMIDSLLPKPVGGFLRAAVWEDNGWSDEGSSSHHRLVGRVGYEREFVVSPNQTIGIEIVAGGGGLWGEAPESRRFFGGNSSSQFLYDGMSDARLLRLPAGPLIRSFGEAEAIPDTAANGSGGDAFWHVNMNLTLPIPGLSHPLIPQDEEVRNALRKGIYVTGRNGLVKALQKEGKSIEEARKEADRTFREIGPATEFIIDEANLFALKPLLMFDVAGLRDGDESSTWSAAGGGLQISIVTAKLELGYMHTLSGPVSHDRGNFFLRLAFQRLF